MEERGWGGGYIYTLLGERGLSWCHFVPFLSPSPLPSQLGRNVPT